MPEPDWWIDHDAHELHFKSRTFPCDRDVEAMALWANQALLLSSDTDCLSLWDAEGLVRIARVGVYPQDMAVIGDLVLVCGGADGHLHQLDLPGLQHRFSLALPGMPERIAWHSDMAHVLTLLTEPDIHTRLISVMPDTWQWHDRLRLPGIPGAIAATASGLWISVSEQVIRLPDGATTPDLVIEGIGLARRIEPSEGGVLITDGLTGQTVQIRT